MPGYVPALFLRLDVKHDVKFLKILLCRGHDSFHDRMRRMRAFSCVGFPLKSGPPRVWILTNNLMIFC